MGIKMGVGYCGGGKLRGGRGNLGRIGTVEIMG